jgi:signal transduction histidine kinase/class 3 adenylate cyclase
MAPVLRAYSVAAAAAAAAFLITRLVWPLIEPTRSPVFLAAVVVSAWYGGLGPGLFATAIAVLTKAHFFLSPMYPFDRDDLPSLLYLLLFVLVGVLISALTGALQRAATVDRERAAWERGARAQAEADNRAKDVVLAKVSHEVRTQLQAMSTWAHVLGRTRLGDRAFGQALAAMHRGVAAQSRLISDLLVVSRIVGGKTDLTMEPVMLHPVVEAAVATATAAAPLPQPAVHIAADSSTGPVFGDRARLEQAVCNVVSNALNFTAADGRVDVRLERDDTSARIIVADTGCGIPTQMLPHLFREFWQGSSAGHRSRGLGLGLAIVRHLVGLHGGTVRADSAGPGCGTTFVIELPLCMAASIDATMAIEHMDGELDRPGIRHQNTIVGGIQDFLTGVRAAPEVDRVLTTVVFIDMVDSTQRTAELGDRGWRDVLERYHQLIRRLLEGFQGREIDTTGDGVFAVFDGPARAIQYASAVTHAVRELGIDVRAGLHTGECQLVGEKVAGIAVHLGARVASLARAGEVLVSATVRDVVAGSGIAFEGRGTHILKGVPGEWPLFAVVPESAPSRVACIASPRPSAAGADRLQPL